MGLSSPGIGSNLNIDSIVTQLMSIEQQPLTVLAQKQASYQSKLSALGSLKSALSNFDSAAGALADPARFQAVNVTSSDSAILSATGTSAADTGSYSIEVSKLAQAQKLVSAGQASQGTAIGTGKIVFNFGTISGGTLGEDGKYTGADFTSNGSGEKSVAIDTTNNTLAGIRDAINSAKIGVTASIINDGSNTPYRLVLTDTTTGKANSMKISVEGGDPALTALMSHDPGDDTAGAQNFTETITAQNAEFKLDGLSISKPSNTVSDLITGVTLKLAKTNVGEPTTITVARDSSSVSNAVNQFVNAYNQINTTLKNLTAYDATTKTAAPLNGDATARSIQNQIRGLLNTPVTSGGNAYSLLSDIGVSMQKDGTLSVDSTKLQKAVDTRFSDIAGLFAAIGTPTDSLVQYTDKTSKTTAGTYALSVTKMASHGSTVGDTISFPLTIADSDHDTLELKVDSVATTIKLAQKTYASIDELAAEMQSKINGASALTAVSSSVTVSASGSALSIMSARWGSGSNVEITGGTAQALVMGAGQTKTAGEDVEGTFNGQPATGIGQFLTGGSGTPADGLKVQITGGSTGARGAITFTNGYAAQFKKTIDQMLGVDGLISARTKGINSSLEEINKQKQTLATRLTAIEERYRKQFTALDAAISSMNQTSTYLTQQLAALPQIE